jgi:colicin import membrane protein
MHTVKELRELIKKHKKAECPPLKGMKKADMLAYAKKVGALPADHEEKPMEDTVPSEMKVLLKKVAPKAVEVLEKIQKGEKGATKKQLEKAIEAGIKETKGGEKPKRPLTEWQKFVKANRKPGVSFKEIGAMFKAQKAGGKVEAPKPEAKATKAEINKAIREEAKEEADKKAKADAEAKKKAMLSPAQYKKKLAELKKELDDATLNQNELLKLKEPGKTARLKKRIDFYEKLNSAQVRRLFAQMNYDKLIADHKNQKKKD